MATVSEMPLSDIHVAPLCIHKENEYSHSASNSISNTSFYRSESRATNASYGMTPPDTPLEAEHHEGRYDDHDHEYTQSLFHNFLRATYPFQPTEIVQDSTVTLPLSEGDIILVHSIHTNGWADGTVLPSGARGWLPTNYCEPYEPEAMRSLLKALLNFWDLLQSGLTIHHDIFSNQEFMKGIIGGVRYLLETSNCLTRESPIIASNDMLRRSRKVLLSDLSSLVKTAKRISEQRMNTFTMDPEPMGDAIDEMLLKAFKIVIRGVRFLDIYSVEESVYQQPHRQITTLVEEQYDPLTPPADATSFQHGEHGSHASADTRRVSYSNSYTTSITHVPEEQTKRLSYRRTSTIGSSNPSQPLNFRRSSVSHRLSTSRPVLDTQRQNCISEVLTQTHDAFLSSLGSLIGRLHINSHTSKELLSDIRQAITAGRSLLNTIEAVCRHDSQTSAMLQKVRDTVYQCINELIVAARECVRPVSSDEDDAMMPRDNQQLRDAATGCVVAAGECVMKLKSVIGMIGDFELDLAELDIDVSAIANGIMEEPSKEDSCAIEEDEDTSDVATLQQATPLIVVDQEKPLPAPPAESPEAVSPLTAAPEDVEEIIIERTKAHLSLLPPLPLMTSPLVSEGAFDSIQQFSMRDSEGQFSSRTGSADLSASTMSTYVGSLRDSETSLVSQTSTRATSPDVHAKGVHHANSSTTSVDECQTEDLDEGEIKVLERTYAHELIFNKEGQVTGGSLPALVERLTSHDSTPDAMFVSTFYLTFRLFATPSTFAEALVDRFEYVGESPHIAGPVRLRVYNAFKGWLETHWRSCTDSEALPIIRAFAEGALSALLPGAAKRLLELTDKVACAEGTIVPRQVSSMGKTSTSIAQYIPPDTPVPAPVMSKSANNALRNWKIGGTCPSVIEFSPVELARQLTIKEMNIFCTIMPEELLASEWMKKTGSHAINVKAMSTLSTDLSNFVADTVLQSESDAKKRAVIIKQWIKIADECLKLNNYDSLMAIICSLNSSMITRLKKTWDVVSQKRKDTLKVLQDIVEPTKNYAVLRQRLQNHVPPCLPFVGTYLTDLTFVDIGNPVTKQLPGANGEDGMSVINFDKHTRTAKIIGELQRFQIPYRLTEVPELQEWIQAQIIRVRSTNDSNNVQQFYRKSLLLEPRVSNSAKQPSPTDTAFSHGPTPPTATKEKFDIFAWAHSSKEKLNLSSSSNTITASS